MKSLGIIGGMGPLATADLYLKITEFTSAASDAEHMHIYIDSNTSIPDRSAAILDGKTSPVQELITSAQKLQTMGADFLVMARNTAHYYYPQVQESVDIPLLNMIEETVDTIYQKSIRQVGVLASSGLQKIHLYEDALRSRGIEPLLPSTQEQAHIMSAIYDCVKASQFNYDMSPFKQVLASLEARGAQGFLLGCTELPVLVSRFSLPGTFFDSTTILAQKAIRFAGFPLNPALSVL